MKSIDILKCKLVRESELEYGTVNTPDKAAGVFRSFGMSDAADEIFAVVCLATDCSVTGIHEISHGNLSSSIVHPREVFKRVILNNASSIILCHNHPSGSLNPSDDDIATTMQLKAAGELLGISIIDHIIVSGNKYFSFKSEGLL